MQTDLHLKGEIAVLGIHLEICGVDEWDGLAGGLGTQDIAERDVLEAEVLADVVHVGDVDACNFASARPSWFALSRLMAGKKPYQTRARGYAYMKSV